MAIANLHGSVHVAGSWILTCTVHELQHIGPLHMQQMQLADNHTGRLFCHDVITEGQQTLANSCRVADQLHPAGHQSHQLQHTSAVVPLSLQALLSEHMRELRIHSHSVHHLRAWAFREQGCTRSHS